MFLLCIKNEKNEKHILKINKNKIMEKHEKCLKIK